MQFQTIKCRVRVMQDGNATTLAVMKAGPDAVSTAEIPILRAVNDIDGGGDEDCSISLAEVVGKYESTMANELTRLRIKYGSQLVNAIYPGGRGLPRTIEDCDLPPGAVEKAKVKAKKAAE